MKEAELLVFKELADMREARDDIIKMGWVMFIFGLVLSCVVATTEALQGAGTMASIIILCIFIAVACICFVIAGLKYGRDCENKLKELKELKKSEKGGK